MKLTSKFVCPSCRQGSFKIKSSPRIEVDVECRARSARAEMKEQTTPQLLLCWSLLEDHGWRVFCRQNVRYSRHTYMLDFVFRKIEKDLRKMATS